MKILIVDDSKLSRVQLADALHRLGHTVIEATSGEEAIDLFKCQNPDLVILDVVMHGMNGFECAMRLRQLKEDWIPIIFVSSTLDDEYISRGIDAGGDDYITKPFSYVTLSAKVKAMQRIADMRAKLLETTRQLNHLSCTDALTGLYNRFRFDEKLTEIFVQAARHQCSFALLFVDIDLFKNVNDQFGHRTGDLVLKEVAKRLSICLRTSDFVARIGGDEFAIILQNLKNEKEALLVARKVMEQGKLPYEFTELGDSSLFVSFSIGVAFSAKGCNDPETFLADADFAMYYAKKSGRNNFQIFRPELRQ